MLRVIVAALTLELVVGHDELHYFTPPRFFLSDFLVPYIRIRTLCICALNVLVTFVGTMLLSTYTSAFSARNPPFQIVGLHDRNDYMSVYDVTNMNSVLTKGRNKD